MKYFIILKSATAASGAVKILRKSGFRVQQGRLTDKSGCRFGIYINNNSADKICKVLGMNNYRCMGIVEVGDGS